MAHYIVLKSSGSEFLEMLRTPFYVWYFKNSLIIHEENTKKNHKRVVSLYVDKDFPSFT